MNWAKVTINKKESWINLDLCTRITRVELDSDDGSKFMRTRIWVGEFYVHAEETPHHILWESTLRRG